ncbi:hypothetical protein L202_08373 [Cryptococcus amylolentus CBS 6039]|uniref:RRM domain-containing protein n=1 Tax=Cryptococcus amylolentus CBS 6039 TaxID=1295533 RepID=A0A1E3H9H1_9TREE|nr:hypothetical protein L202_08373 [Cryptococcus amylolentus CBS 6039]ODN72970.1 hypothetical protein L202_08373 [Cryptococcus amylolentus CBS 6039]
MASNMDIDKSLDEIIAAKPKPQRQQRQGGASRGRRGGAGGGAPAAAGAGGARARYASTVPKAAGAVPAGVPEVFKIIISNLPGDVTEAAVRDLIQSTVGPVKSVQMAYTAHGKGNGIATVVFKNKGDARKAHASYHNRMIDNQRPMKVELCVDLNAVQAPLANRVAPAAQGQQGQQGQGQRRRAPGPNKPRPARPQKKTAEQLDAEMADYKQTTSA